MDPAKIGSAVLTLLATQRALGHASPLGTLDYIAGGFSREQQVVLALVAECSITTPQDDPRKAAAIERNNALIAELGLLDLIADAVAR